MLAPEKRRKRRSLLKGQNKYRSLISDTEPALQGTSHCVTAWIKHETKAKLETEKANLVAATGQKASLGDAIDAVVARKK